MKFTASHEWVENKNNIATIGITDFAASELGDIVFIQLPEVGDEVEIDEAFAEVESVKAVSPVNSPVSGKVVEINESLNDNPELVNANAFDTWFIKVAVKKEGNLISLEQYKALIKK